MLAPQSGLWWPSLLEGLTLLTVCGPLGLWCPFFQSSSLVSQSPACNYCRGLISRMCTLLFFWLFFPFFSPFELFKVSISLIFWPFYGTPHLLVCCLLLLIWCCEAKHAICLIFQSLLKALNNIGPTVDFKGRILGASCWSPYMLRGPASLHADCLCSPYLISLDLKRAWPTVPRSCWNQCEDILSSLVLCTAGHLITQRRDYVWFY